MAVGPAVIACPADVWTKVATNVTTAALHRLSVAPNVYMQTYRGTGEAAPINNNDAAIMFSASPDEELISNDVAIDVYVQPVGVAGSVRLDQ